MCIHGPRFDWCSRETSRRVSLPRYSRAFYLVTSYHPKSASPTSINANGGGTGNIGGTASPVGPVLSGDHVDGGGCGVAEGKQASTAVSVAANATKAEIVAFIVCAPLCCSQVSG